MLGGQAVVGGEHDGGERGGEAKAGGVEVGLREAAHAKAAAVEVDQHRDLPRSGGRHEHAEAKVVGLVVDDVLPSDCARRVGRGQRRAVGVGEDERGRGALDGAVAEELDDAEATLDDLQVTVDMGTCSTSAYAIFFLPWCS